MALTLVVSNLRNASWQNWSAIMRTDSTDSPTFGAHSPVIHFVHGQILQVASVWIANVAYPRVNDWSWTYDTTQLWLFMTKNGCALWLCVPHKLYWWWSIRESIIKPLYYTLCRLLSLSGRSHGYTHCEFIPQYTPMKQKLAILDGRMVGKKSQSEKSLPQNRKEANKTDNNWHLENLGDLQSF